jgi:mannosyl-3-phosphoglycerate phosphatase
MQSYIIFTDLDGTLLDHHTYSFDAALSALNFIRKKQIPLILVSSKTAAEMMVYQKKLNVEEYPFVVENGSAIYTKSNYFLNLGDKEVNGDYDRYVLGKTYDEIVLILAEISEQNNYIIRGFHNASREEIKNLTGLAAADLDMAMMREYSIPLFYDRQSEEILINSVDMYNLHILYGGRFMHLLGRVDKGEALKRIMKGYRNRFSNLQFKSIAIGDSHNDFAMLMAADHAILVKKHDNTHEKSQIKKHITYSSEIGPVGWNHAVLDLIQNGGCDE